MGMTTQTLLMSNLGALSVASSQPGRLMGHGDSIAHLGQEGDGSMSDFTIEQLEALKEGTTPGPWKFQPWGAQNQNGDHAESVLMDDSGETIAYGLPNSVGETVSRIPALVDALIAEKQAHAKLRAEVKRLQETAYAEANKRLTLGDTSDYAVGEEQKYFYLELTRILEATDG